MFEEEIMALEDMRKSYKWNVTGDTALLRAVKAFRVLNTISKDKNATLDLVDVVEIIKDDGGMI